MEFKAETKKLLEIVAKSLYTEKEVFIRELLSNCSDALEKQKFKELSGASQPTEQLYINIMTNENERKISIFDSVIGMNKSEIIKNLGTIAYSGSSHFIDALKGSSDLSKIDTIIGQFGVGFYSTFIVADYVEVISKADNDQTVRWISDGSGNFEVSDVEGYDFKRGTLINIKLKNESRQFAREREIESIIKKYSMFISFHIKLNNELVNVLQAIWTKSKNDFLEEEFSRFFEHISGS